MFYILTTDDIIFESTYVADITKIETATSMVIEHYNDVMNDDEITYGEYLEAAGGVVSAVKSFIQKIITKIKELFAKLAGSVAEAKNAKKVKEAFSPEFREKIKEAEKAGLHYIEDIDLDELRKVADQSEKFIMKASGALEKEAQAVVSATKRKDQLAHIKKLDRLMEGLDDKYDEIMNHFDDVSHKKVKIPIGKIMDMAKNGIDYSRESEKIASELASELEKFSSLMDRVNDMLDQEPSSSETASVIRRAASKINDWASKHSKLVKTIKVLAVAGVTAGVAAVAGGPISKAAGDVSSKVSAAASKASETASKAAGDVSSKVSDTIDSVSNAVQDKIDETKGDGKTVTFRTNTSGILSTIFGEKDVSVTEKECYSVFQTLEKISEYTDKLNEVIKNDDAKSEEKAIEYSDKIKELKQELKSVNNTVLKEIKNLWNKGKTMKSTYNISERKWEYSIVSIE